MFSELIGGTEKSRKHLVTFLILAEALARRCESVGAVTSLKRGENRIWQPLPHAGRTACLNFAKGKVFSTSLRCSQPRLAWATPYFRLFIAAIE